MVAFPTLTTMAIAGIWHGANLTFLVFGLLHGVYLTINHGWRLWTPKGSPLHQKLPHVASVGITFIAVIVGQIFFPCRQRARRLLRDWQHAWAAPRPFFCELPWTSGYSDDLKVRALPEGHAAWRFLSATSSAGQCPTRREILNELPKDQKRMASLLPRLSWKLSTGWSLGLAALLTFSLLMLDSGAKFLYFQF